MLFLCDVTFIFVFLLSKFNNLASFWESVSPPFSKEQLRDSTNTVGVLKLARILFIIAELRARSLGKKRCENFWFWLWRHCPHVRTQHHRKTSVIGTGAGHTKRQSTRKLLFNRQHIINSFRDCQIEERSSQLLRNLNSCEKKA